MAQRIQRVAEDKTIVRVNIKELADAELVACAEELLASAVPDGEGKVADQMFDAVFFPGGVSV